MKLKFFKFSFINTGFTYTSMNFDVSSTKAKRGFTLVELLVVFSISALIGLMVIIGYPDFASNIEFKNQVLDIATTIREAQVYGLSVKEAGTGSFDTAYGVSFDINTPDSYIFFADINDNKSYDISTDSIVGGAPLILKEGYTISDLCVLVSTGFECNSDGGYLNLNTLSIFFKRPNPDANIKTGIFSDFASGLIKIKNIAGNTKTIRVTNTGQISVQ